MSPREIKKLQTRSRALRVEVLSPKVVSVVSRSLPPVQHFVTVEWLGDGDIRARCTCPWGLNGGMCCSHVMAALNELASRKHRVVSFWDDHDVAERQKHRLLRLVGHGEDEELFLTTRPA